MASPDIQQGTIRFGQFELDRASRELRRSGSVVKLQRQQFAVLQLLVEHAGQIVSREEIHQHIWGSDTFVDFERGINFAINQIRVALEDDAEKPRFVETIPRRGYRFIATVQHLMGEATAPDVTASQASGDGKAESANQERVNISPARFLSTQRILIGGLILFLAVAILLVLSRVWHSEARSAQTHTVAANVRTISQIIIHGEINGLGLSPDGRQIAFTWDGANHGRPNIYVQKVEGDRPMQITQSQSGTISGVDWSPDGRLLAFGHCGDEDRGALYVISPVGGAEQKITDFTCSYGDADAVWTPDGSALVFSDNCAPGGSRGISVFTLATGRKRCLAAPNSNLLSIPSLAVSPDGRFVAYVGDSASRIADVYIVPFSDGAPRRITFERRAFCCMMWTPDGEYIVLESDRTGQFSKWRVSAKGGAIEPETVYTQDAVFSRDGRRQAYVVEGDTQLGIWRAQLPGPGGKVLSQKRITPVAPSADVSAQLSPDGRQIVFVSTVSGSSENIWKADADGNNLLQLTSSAGQDNGSPHWSPDGKWIAFDRTAGEHAQIYVIDAEGRNLHAITDGTFASNVPTWSRDGKSIYFSSNRSGRWELWKQDIGSGVAAQITQHGGFTAVESYDGKDLYYTKFFTTGIWRMPIGGGEEQRITDAPDPVYWGYWDVAQAGLYFIDVGASPRPAIEFYDFRTQQVTTVFQLDELARSLEPNLSVSRDGRTIYYALVDMKSTIMIGEYFQ